MSTDLHTLSGAYAVDALSVEEAEQFASHLEQCEACRDEVLELQSAAAQMGASEASAPPPALKARVLAAADRTPQLPPKVTSLEAARSRRWSTRVAAAAAAVVLVVAAGLGLTQLRGSGDHTVSSASVAKVFEAKDAKTETIDTSNGGKLTVALSQQLGRVAVDSHALPTLSDEQVYQLWSMHRGTATSIGVVTNVAAGKVVSLPAGHTTMAVTIEPRGGSERPTTRPIVTVDPASI